MSMREEFEAAVIERFKALGCLPVDFCTDLLQRSGDDYESGSVSAYWHFWKASRLALEIRLPEPHWFGEVQIFSSDEVLSAVEAAGVRMKI